MKGVVAMRQIQPAEIQQAVTEELKRINTVVPPDLRRSLHAACDKSSGAGKLVMEDIVENMKLAELSARPLCQDTGMVVFFARVGIGVLLSEPMQDTLARAVGQVYPQQGYRPSVVADPLERKNTGDNTPSITYVEQVEGQGLVIEMMAKGFGSENMSRLTMLTPSHGFEGVRDFVVETVRKAGGNPCPPTIVGVGVGGTFEYAAMLAKKALLRPVGSPHPLAEWAEREQIILTAVNQLGIGPGGVGGDVTALAVHMEFAPTHIAGLPVAVNLVCHSSRHGKVMI
jgi:fumarate hydratase subunit alpha